MRGQLVKAFVVLNSQYKRKDSTELVRELQEHVKSNAAPYKASRYAGYMSASADLLLRPLSTQER